MAYLTAEADTNANGRGQRGQILLVTAFALAVVFIGLALVLNSVIFTENLATRSEATTTSDAITHRNTIETGTADIIRHINENISTNASGDYSPLERNLTHGFRNVSTVSTRQQLYDGQVVNNTLHYRSSLDRGTVIRQTDEDRQYRDVSGLQKDWDVASSIDGARAFRMHVTDSSLEDGTQRFIVEVDTPSGTWWLNVTQSGPDPAQDEVKIAEPGPSVIGTCPSSHPPYWINVSEGTTDGKQCSALREFRDRALANATKIRYEQGNRTEGTYRLVVNATYSVVDALNNHATGGTGQPYIKPAIYATNATVTYRSRVVTYGTEFRVVPGVSEDD